MIWDLYQQLKIGEVRDTSERAAASAQLAQAEVSSVEAKLDRLTLLTMAMWEFQRERMGLTDIDLAKKMHEIDLRDGIADGKAGPEAVNCPSCGRTISSHDEICIYCSKDNSSKAKIIFP